ncbi:MAG: sigma 54-interacting transcriptional regulator [Pyrinomonadaceae bacterium]
MSRGQHGTHHRISRPRNFRRAQAATRATADRRGLIQQFAGGTLFLDEIDEADDKVQAMLKRVVEYGTYERVGDPTEMRSEVRFIVATNRIAQDRALIKEDFRDRFWEIRVPSLRERRADIRPLAEHFARKHEYALPEPVLAWLESPALFWPGNIRQLQTVVERACSLAHDASDLTLDFFRQCVADTSPPPAPNDSVFNEDSPSASLEEGETLAARLQKIERTLILRALADAGGNKTQAAERLGGTRQWLYKRCHALKIKTTKSPNPHTLILKHRPHSSLAQTKKAESSWALPPSACSQFYSNDSCTGRTTARQRSSCPSHSQAAVAGAPATPQSAPDLPDGRARTPHTPSSGNGEMSGHQHTPLRHNRMRTRWHRATCRPIARDHTHPGRQGKSSVQNCNWRRSLASAHQPYQRNYCPQQN